MSTHSQLQQQSRRVALCGLLAALSVVLLSLGSFIPLATIACPMLAMICLQPIVGSCGCRTALLVYTAVSVLAVLLCADKELACYYVFLGWYPILRPRLNRLPRMLCGAVKCGIYTLAMAAMYALLLYLFRMEALVEEFAAYTAWLIICLVILGNVTFLLFDRALGVLDIVFRRKWKRK